jgi:hypothetical protein
MCRTPGCFTLVECDGDYEPNHDGHPPVICTAVHLPGGYTDPPRCERCATSRCPDCGSVTRLEPHDRDCARRPVVSYCDVGADVIGGGAC